MRDEFPALARLGRPAIGVEPLWWAFLSGLGAGPLVGGIVRIAFLWLGPLVLPPTRPHPEWLSVNTIVLTITVLAVGAVLIRAGGVVAMAAYLGYELVRLLAALPGRALTCKNGQIPPSFMGCDYLALVTEHWVTWAGLLAGAVIGVLFVRTRDGENGLLRATGAFSLALVIANTVLGAVLPGRPDGLTLSLVLFPIANLIAGGFAGVLLARERLAAAVLLTVLIGAPGASLTLSFVTQSTASAKTFQEFAQVWQGLYVPALAVLALVTTRGYVRRGDGGTFI